VWLSNGAIAEFLGVRGCSISDAGSGTPAAASLQARETVDHMFGLMYCITG